MHGFKWIYKFALDRYRIDSILTYLHCTERKINRVKSDLFVSNSTEWMDLNRFKSLFRIEIVFIRFKLLRIERIHSV